MRADPDNQHTSPFNVMKAAEASRISVASLVENQVDAKAVAPEEGCR